jgi:hypothetical protein
MIRIKRVYDPPANADLPVIALANIDRYRVPFRPLAIHMTKFRDRAYIVDLKRGNDRLDFIGC